MASFADVEEATPAPREEYVASPFGPSAIGRNEAVALDRDALKLLASDTRLDILKTLRQRRMTVSELSSALALGKSTVFEHVNKLVDGGLVIRHDDPKREWVYYELAPKARRLFNPVSAKIVLMFSSVVGIALAALLTWSLVSTAGAGIHVEVGPEEVLAGESRLFEVAVLTADGQAYPGASLGLLSAEEYARFREGEAVQGKAVHPRLGADGEAEVRLALEEGDWYLTATSEDGELASRDGSGLVRVTPAELHVDPSPLLIGADADRQVRVWLTHADRVVDEGSLFAEGNLARFLGGSRTLEVDDPIETTRFTLLGAGEAEFSFKPAGEGSYFAPVRGSVRIDVPQVSVAPAFLVAGQPANLTVTVWHDARGAIPDAPVRVHVDEGSQPGVVRTDARGVVRLPIVAEGPEPAKVYLGDYAVARVPVVRQMIVHTAVTSLGLEIWAQDLATREPLVNADVELGGIRVAGTDIHGHALVPGKGPVAVRADGYAPYGLNVPGYAARNVHWVSAVEDVPREDARSPVVTVTEIEVTASEVRIPAGGVVHVTARMHNPGATSIVETAVLTVDGSRWSVQDVPLAPGEARSVEFPVMLREPGLHRLSVNDASVLEVFVESPPKAVHFATNEAPAPWALGLAGVAAAAFALTRRRN